ncbi:MAG: RluA family pseudouridine synthase [Desulfobulbaceae bacterium]|nr:RluA family pseudouridine synthase [Desulfobulbaceae bacterium]MCK5322609.1 RluA family pseudouridine synthase [Desulfobulbaceae bacterium]
MYNDRQNSQYFCFHVRPEDSGQRLDLFLARNNRVPGATRSMIRNLIRFEHVLLNGQNRKPGCRLRSGDEIKVTVPPPEPSSLVPEDISFEIIHEDDDLVVLSKPPGVVVHPAAGHRTGTLVHGLLFHCNDLSGINGEMRPGIVHRLDRDTSGIMVVAKNDQAHHNLVSQFKARKVEKIYHAILDGCPEVTEGRISLPIGRHPVNRKKMAVLESGGREAATNWKILEKLPGFFSYVEVRLETGRTHQIRVHMAEKNCPVAGDEVYGRKNRKWASLGINRQCLHSSILAFTHPSKGKIMRFTAPLWPDIASVLERLRVTSGE